MKILHYAWGAYNDKILKNNLIKLGFEIITVDIECQHYSRDMKLASVLINTVKESSAEAIISFNYFPIISLVSDSLGIPYFSWIYDSPHLTLQAKTIDLPCNHIGLFDRDLYEYMKINNHSTCKYVPLSVDSEYFDEIISATKDDFHQDISFVGSLYTGDYNYYNQFKNNAEIWNNIDPILERQCFEYREDIISEMIMSDNNNEIFNYLNKKRIKSGLVLDEDYYDAPEYIVINEILKKQVTVLEREKLLNSLASIYGNRFAFYTNSDLSRHSSLNLVKHNPVSYLEQMPVVFNHSKINLNITLRTIKTGIPLRALDILGSGGFLLSNYQAELNEYFEDGKELVLFTSLDDCMEKIDYYLTHEDERQKIAIAGKEKVSRDFSYSVGLSRLFNL